MDNCIHFKRRILYNINEVIIVLVKINIYIYKSTGRDGDVYFIVIGSIRLLKNPSFYRYHYPYKDRYSGILNIEPPF